ncbi:hypothetical protein [Pseudomonas sp. FEN]|nr:hypothetical protein [Pseudomonas sp. FEN]
MLAMRSDGQHRHRLEIAIASKLAPTGVCGACLFCDLARPLTGQCMPRNEACA